MADNVNHPEHYEKAGHKECIDLLLIITRGYSGIAAGDLMQAKYLYRAGSKDDAGMTQNEKTYEDLKKFNWYLNHFKKSAIEELGSSTAYNLPAGWSCFSRKTEEEMSEVITEFIWDKPDDLKEDLAKVLHIIMCMTTFNELEYALETMNKILVTYSTKKN